MTAVGGREGASGAVGAPRAPCGCRRTSAASVRHGSRAFRMPSADGETTGPPGRQGLRGGAVSPARDPMKRGGSAVWAGGLKDGRGTVSTDSGALKDLAYSFSMRFEDAPGTNPEELVAAAHAGCFSMAFSAELGKAGLTPERGEARGTAGLRQTGA